MPSTPDHTARDQLAALLWGDYPDSEARRSLRVALSTIRSTLGDISLTSDNDSVRLNPGFPLSVDALVFQSAAARLLAGDEDNDSFIDLYGGDLLTGYDDDGSPLSASACARWPSRPADAWPSRRRAHSDYAGAIEAAQRVLAIEPANERAHQHLMFCLNAPATAPPPCASTRPAARPCRTTWASSHLPRPRTSTTGSRSSRAHAAAEARITNLPIPLTSFVGRQREIAEVSDLLAHHRLVTLTGPGGSGKTRLAIEVAAGLVDAYPDGVWFIDLSSVQDAVPCPAPSPRQLGAAAAQAADATPALVAICATARPCSSWTTASRSSTPAPSSPRRSSSACPSDHPGHQPRGAGRRR